MQKSKTAKFVVEGSVFKQFALHTCVAANKKTDAVLQNNDFKNCFFVVVVGERSKQR